MSSLTGTVSLDKSKLSSKLMQNFSLINSVNDCQNYVNDYFQFRCEFNSKIQKKGHALFGNNIFIGFIGEIFDETGFIDDPFTYIFHKYLESPQNLLNSLNGSYSFFIFDFANYKFVLSVDSVATKPIFYTVKEGVLFFSSEISFFSKEFKKKINSKSISDIVTNGFVNLGKTLYQEINEINPGSYITLEKSQITIGRYFLYSPNSNSPDLGFTHFRKTLASLLDNAVRIRIRKDQPMGLMLSGGIDSRVILGLMDKYCDKVKTISFYSRPSESIFSDYHISKLVSKFYKTKHYSIDIDLENFLSTVGDVSRLSGGLARPLPENEIYKVISQNLKINRLFTGDEVFGRFDYFIGDNEQMMDLTSYTKKFSIFFKRLPF